MQRCQKCGIDGDRCPCDVPETGTHTNQLRKWQVVDTSTPNHYPESDNSEIKIFLWLLVVILIVRVLPLLFSMVA